MHHFGGCALHLIVGPNTQEAEDHENGRGDQRQENAVAGSAIRTGLVALAQGLAQQGVDTHANTDGKADLHILHRKCQAQSRDRRLAVAGDINAVHHIVKCLDQHA